MTLDEAIQKSYLFATGKPTAPTAGSKKYEKLKLLLNVAKDDWASEPGIYWTSLRAQYTVPTAVTATDTIPLGNVGKVSKQEGDTVKITHTDGTSVTEYTIVPADQLDYYYGNTSNVVAIQGNYLLFPEAFTASSAEFSGTITVPHYLTPADAEAADDEIPVDNPLWACYAAAAEYVRTDLVNKGEYPNLLAKANNLLMSMKEDNYATVTDIYSPDFLIAGGQTWD